MMKLKGNFQLVIYSYFCVELPILVNKFKLQHSEIPTYERKRLAGKVKVNSFIDGFIILKSMISLFLTNK